MWARVLAVRADHLGLLLPSKARLDNIPEARPSDAGRATPPPPHHSQKEPRDGTCSIWPAAAGRGISRAPGSRDALPELARVEADQIEQVFWRARQDSNLRPSAPEADALSTELQARGPR